MRLTRPDCGGIYGSGVWGGCQYGAHVQCGTGLRTTRPDCGGIWGTGTWGQRYYAGHYQCEPPLRTTRPDCGGIWGTGAWGMRHYGGHIQCGYVPPVPPTPTPSAKGYANGGRRRRLKEEDLDDLLFIIACWNAAPRQNASRTN
jgi:hypothetical protein